MKQYRVIGESIDYSLSPIIHNALFKKNKHNAHYEILNISSISSEIHKLRHLSGFNITIPYKQAILQYCDFQSDDVREIGACNTIKVENGLFHAFNTDVYGFYMLMKKHQLDHYKNPNVLIIGAGGASKAVFYTLQTYFDVTVTVCNRTLANASMITSNSYTIKEAMEEIDMYDIVINATNVGVKQYESPIELKKIKENSVFIDLNYQQKLKFLDDSHKLGAKTINGLDMLVYQAAKSYEIWFNEPYQLDTIEDAIGKENEKC